MVGGVNTYKGFFSIAQSGCWWSSGETLLYGVLPGGGWAQSIPINDFLQNTFKNWGYSVRCLKND
jgi:hypothetical protein